LSTNEQLQKVSLGVALFFNLIFLREFVNHLNIIMVCPRLVRTFFHNAPVKITKMNKD
jgi:hypothetical protein